jgi:hypothetical protein
MLPEIHIHFELGSHHHHFLCKPHILVCLLMFPDSHTHDLNVTQPKDAFGVSHIPRCTTSSRLFPSGLFCHCISNRRPNDSILVDNSASLLRCHYLAPNVINHLS